MKFGIRSAVDVVFKTTRAYTGEGQDYLLKPGMKWAKGEPVLYFDTLKASTTEGTAETVYAQGGKGNPRLIAWEGDKTVTFTFEDALISIEGMSILTGADLIEASEERTVRAHRKAVVQIEGAEEKVSTFGDIDLDDEAKGGEPVVDLEEAAGGDEIVPEDIFGFEVNGQGEIIQRLGAGELDGTKVTFEGEVADDAFILVDFYVEKTTGAQEINITPDKFAGYFYIEGDTLFRRQSDGKDLPAQIIIPNAKIQTAFEFSMSPDGDPSTFTFTADAFPGHIAGDKPGADPKMYALRILDE